MVYGYMLESNNKSNTNIVLESFIQTLNKEYEVFNSIFESFLYLNESGVLLEGEGIKGIFKKIGEGIRWLRDKLKQFFAKIKEYIRKFIMDEEDFKYNFRNIDAMYEKIDDDAHKKYGFNIFAQDPKDFNEKDYMTDIKIHHKSIKVLPVYTVLKMHLFEKDTRKEKKQRELKYGSYDDEKKKLYKAYIVKYPESTYFDEYKRNHDNKAIWVSDIFENHIGKEFTLKSKGEEDQLGYKDENSKKLNELRKDVAECTIEPIQAEIKDFHGYGQYKDIFTMYELDTYNTVDKELNKIVDELEKELNELNTSNGENVNSAHVEDLIHDITYVKEIIGLNAHMMQLYTECNSKNAAQCWRLVFKLVKPANPFAAKKELQSIKNDTDKE